MNAELISKLATSLVEVLSLIAAASPLIISGVKFLKAHTKNKRLQLIENYAMRVVQAVEQNANLLPSDKKKAAKRKLSSYLDELNIKIKVTEEQLDDIIEQAVNTLKDDTSKGSIVKVNQPDASYLIASKEEDHTEETPLLTGTPEGVEVKLEKE